MAIATAHFADEWNVFVYTGVYQGRAELITQRMVGEENTQKRISFVGKHKFL